MNPYLKIFKKHNVEVKMDQDLPEDILEGGVRDLFYVEKNKTIFDPYKNLEYNEVEILWLRGYNVYQEDNFTIIIEIILKDGLSNN